MGLREQRKLRTRRTLMEVALRLFEERGYEATTVAEISAAAEVSPATFFNYFPSKEDVIFADRLLQGEVPARFLGEPRPGETPAQALHRALYEALESPLWTIDPEARDLVLTRVRVIASVPALRARALLEVAELQERWSADLVAVFDGQLDDFEADVLTGAAIGALLAVAGRALRDETPDRSLTDLVRRSVAAALNAPAPTTTAPAPR
ncbi:TetR family transcriptional regulator [Rhizohabitans arisaemae]|uniref:TetR family transcriptional regulator n=1 Tax=Rhizohabitans arisaemae TaxID=2720610 RepID=UPI0024B04364|nr:TetR family transcriptional regulator [Rhizohabitans arisaemae]